LGDEHFESLPKGTDFQIVSYCLHSPLHIWSQANLIKIPAYRCMIASAQFHPKPHLLTVVQQVLQVIRQDFPPAFTTELEAEQAVVTGEEFHQKVDVIIPALLPDSCRQLFDVFASELFTHDLSIPRFPN
jgi:hypothetical protein